MTENYEGLAARAARGELAVKPHTVVRGPAAAAAANKALMEATGAPTPQKAAQLAMGRPPVGTKRGPSPTVRARVPQTLKDRVHALAEREQRDESDIVREALAAYVELRHAS